MSSVNDPAKAIQAILVRGQIERSSVSVAINGATTSVSVNSAYASNMVSDGDLMNATTEQPSVWAEGSVVAEPSDITHAAQAALAAMAASSANDPANGTTEIATQDLVDDYSPTNTAGGALVVSVLGQSTDADQSGSSSSSATASATFLSIAAYQQLAAARGAPITLSTSDYVAQTGSAGTVSSTKVTLSLPDTAQQVAYAVAEINELGPYAMTLGPHPHSDKVNVTAADAVNVTIANGAVSVTGDTQGVAVPNDLPSLANIQKAIGQLIGSMPESYPARVGLDPDSYQGNVTLIKLPANSMNASGDNFTVFSTSDQWNLNTDDKWALVLPQDTATVTISSAQSQG